MDFTEIWSTLSEQCSSSLRDCAFAISELPKQFEPFTTWFTSIVSISVFINFLSSWWKRPIIRVRLENTRDCYGPTPLTLNHIQNDVVVAREQRQGRYLRLRVQNTGRTMLKNCSGHLQEIRSEPSGRATPVMFDSEVVECGWAHLPGQPKRDIPRDAHFHMDVPAATLILSLNGASSALYMEKVPVTLVEYLGQFPGKTTHTYIIRIDADDASPRKVPVQFTFDPTQPDLTSIIPFDTRYPGWRVRWWLRTLWARRSR